MKVRDFVKLLSEFHDQDAEVLVVHHTSGSGWYEQGGSVKERYFDPEMHLEYNDLRGNPSISPDCSYYNSHELLIGYYE